MKSLFYFTLGVVLTLAAMSYAQQGSVLDSNGNMYQYYTFPGGGTSYWSPKGGFGTIYQMPSQHEYGRNPC